MEVLRSRVGRFSLISDVSEAVSQFWDSGVNRNTQRKAPAFWSELMNFLTLESDQVGFGPRQG